MKSALTWSFCTWLFSLENVSFTPLLVPFGCDERKIPSKCRIAKQVTVYYSTFRCKIMKKKSCACN